MSLEDKEKISDTSNDKHLKYPPELKEERKEKRLEILKMFLYGAGVFYVLLSVIIICLQLRFNYKSTSEMIILVTIIGSSITTIIGVIAGTSID